MALVFNIGTPIAHAAPKTHWIATWATAQELAPTIPDVPNVPPTVKRPNFRGSRTNARPEPLTDIRDKTIRMTARVGVGGYKIRVELSNAFGKKPVFIGAVHIARKGKAQL